MSKILQNKLLAVAASGAHVLMDMAQVDSFYKELKLYVANHADSTGAVELFELYDLHVQVSLMTGHDVEAKAFLDRLVDQFGAANSERIKFLQSLYYESVGRDADAARVLSEKSDELGLLRRLVTLTRGKSREEYVKNLLYYLDLQASDLVAWSELGHEYQAMGHYDKAVFCFKEILLQEPLAYPFFYKVGLLHYYIFLQNYKLDILKKDKLAELVDHLEQSRNNYLRAIEICRDHKLSWLGIYVLTQVDIVGKLAKFKEFDAYLKDNARLASASEAKVCELNGIDRKQLATWIN